MNTLCLLLVVEMGVWLAIAVKLSSGGTLRLEPNWLVYVVAGACSLVDYTFFLHEDRWKGYARQFRAEAAPHQRRAAWGAFAAVLTVLGSVMGPFID